MSTAVPPTDDMRKRAEWMVPSDDQILEILRDEGNLTPLAVSEFGGPSRQYVRERLPKLAKYGLVTRISAGLYQITAAGQAYLDEELDASMLTPANE